MSFLELVITLVNLTNTSEPQSLTIFPGIPKSCLCAGRWQGRNPCLVSDTIPGPHVPRAFGPKEQGCCSTVDACLLYSRRWVSRNCERSWLILAQGCVNCAETVTPSLGHQGL